MGHLKNQRRGGNYNLHIFNILIIFQNLIKINKNNLAIKKKEKVLSYESLII